MKKSLALFLVLVLAVGVIAGCSSDKKESSATSPSDDKDAQETVDEDIVETKEEAEEPADSPDEDPEKEPTEEPEGAAGGVVRASLGADVPTVDPQGKTPNTVSNSIDTHILEGLVRVHGNDVLPGIAETWEISDDGLVYTFHLRDALWSDGVPVTADDFVTGFQRLMLPETASNSATFGYYIVNGEAINAGELPVEELGIKALDEKTVEITLVNPTAYFITMLGNAYFFPSRADLVAKFGDSFATTPETNVYNGPFLFTEWQVENTLKMVKNPDYWNAAAIKLDAIEFFVVGNTDTAGAMFQADELDFVFAIDEATKDLYPEAKSYNASGTNFVRFNVDGSNPVTANKNFRLAFNAAFDRTQFLALAGLTNEHTNGRICFAGIRGVEGDYGDEYPVEIPMTADLVTADGYMDLALQELGLSDPADITVELLVKDTDQERKNGAILQDMMLKNLGINITIRSLPNAEWLAEHKNHTYDMIAAAWSPDYNDPLTYMAVYVSNSPYNHASYNNPEFDELVTKIEANTDAKDRMDMVFEAEKILLDDAISCPLFYTIRYYLLSDNLHGVQRGAPSPDPDFVYSYFSE